MPHESWERFDAAQFREASRRLRLPHPSSAACCSSVTIVAGGVPVRELAGCLPVHACLVDVRADAALEEAAGDDHALDLARALPDPVDAELAEVALHGMLGHVATAAEDLERAVGDPVRRLRGIELRH